MKNIIAILLFLISITVNATKYYVATTGDNGNDGSIGSPWKTVAYAATQVTTGGDSIMIGLGVFNESTNQIIKAVGVSIVGTMIASDTTHIISSYVSGAYDGSIYCSSTAGTTTDDNSSISYIKLTGNNYTATRGIYNRYRNNLKIHHCVIEDFGIAGITLSASMTSYPDLYITGNEIHHCVINNSSSLVGTAGYGSVRLMGTDGVLVHDNTFDNTARPTGYNGSTFELYRNKNHQIYNNTFYRNDHEITAGGVAYWNFFLEEWNYRGNGQFYNNTLYGLAQFSLGGDDNQIVAGCSYGYKVYGNQWLNSANGNRVYNGEDRTAYAICIEGGGHEKVEVFRNYIQRFAWGIEISCPRSSDDPERSSFSQNWIMDDIKIHYNIVENIGYADMAISYGIFLIQETHDPPYYNTFSNIVIANNVVTGNNGGTYPGYYGIAISGNGTLTDLDITNNIVYEFASYGIHIEEHLNDGYILDSCDVTYNLMNGNGYNTVYFEEAIDETNADIITGNITDAPLFVGGSPYDYSLQPDSPAINAGIDVGLTQDYAGNTVPYGITDIGAYEYYDEPLIGTAVFAKDANGNFIKDANGNFIKIIQ